MQNDDMLFTIEILFRVHRFYGDGREISSMEAAKSDSRKNNIQEERKHFMLGEWQQQLSEMKVSKWLMLA